MAVLAAVRSPERGTTIGTPARPPAPPSQERYTPTPSPNRPLCSATSAHSAHAVQLSGYARLLATDGPPLLRSWLAAAHGEALAADDQPDASLRAFDAAYDLLPDVPGQLADGPYLALDAAHLIRWRGHALARFGSPDATILLRAALDQRDAEFTRAEAGLRTDLVLAYLALGEHDAARHELAAARRIADAVDSRRGNNVVSSPCSVALAS